MVKNDLIGQRSNHKSEFPPTKNSFREYAENIIGKEDVLNNGGLKQLSHDEVNQIIHELKVHQIELEMQNDELRRIQTELDKTKARYFDIYDLAPEGYLIISKSGLILETNLTAADMLGYTRGQLHKKRFSEFIYKFDQEIYYLHQKRLSDSFVSKGCEIRILRNDGTMFWGHLKATSTMEGDACVYRIILSDIGYRKEIEQTLTESEEKYKSLVMSMDQGLALHEIILDDTGKPIDYVFLDINESYTRILGFTRDMCIGKRVREVMPLVEQYWIDIFGEVALTGKPSFYENFSETTGRYYSTYVYSPKINLFAVLVSDIDEQVKREREINYISFHDQLTGIYNRRFYEEELRRLDTERNFPLTIAMGDLNGLKLINDSFGHNAGDELLKKVAEAITDGCRADDIIARIGGDEFVIILPHTSYAEAENVVARIKKSASNKKTGMMEVSISFGHQTKVDNKQRIEDVFKDAEDHMYRNKLYESSSIKSNMINLIMNTLYESNPREMLHSQRVSELCVFIAQSMNFSTQDINQVRIAGLMHDIGKIGIDENVLNGVGRINDEEWKEIKRHPEVGYRILSASNEFSRIANFTLEHHEHWDGTGYPKGLKGEEISVFARIIAIADAFDAMTRERTYKKMLSEKEAIDEIKRCAGIQFDPEIAKVFTEQYLIRT
jgi:diguanylate cyclase (GGDEF)-like protein/PAS domain S-box-containing protein